jgi:hypothetical protein
MNQTIHVKQVALNGGGQDSGSRSVFTSLSEQLERIEPSIDPYSDPDLLEQWTLCIGEVVRRQQAVGGGQGAPSNSTGKFEGRRE